MEYTLLNIASFILGIISWVLPLILIFKNINYKKVSIFSILSLILTIISVYFQFIYTNYLVKIEDWSAIEDTNDTVLFFCTVLILGTFILNFILLKIKYKKN